MIDQIKEFIEGSKNVLSNMQDELKIYHSDIEIHLASLLENLNVKNTFVQGRVKTTNSLNEKIYRKNYYSRYKSYASESPLIFIKELPDLIGVRIVCLLNQDEFNVYSKLCNEFMFEVKELSNEGNVFLSNFAEENRENDYLCILSNYSDAQPKEQKNGNPLYRINCKWYNKQQDKYINVELQIKSLVHFFWGELEHMLFYKNYSYLIASDFYKKYMQQIDYELKNIDTQLLSLKEQINKDVYKQQTEVKEIAAMILYSTYNNYVNEIIGCSIDLREVFDVIVDMYFENIIDQELMYENLKNFIPIARKSETACAIDMSISDDTCINSEIRTKGTYILNTINQLLISDDIYWVTFYKIYSDVHQCSDHTISLEVISEQFMKMITIFEDEFDMAEDDESEERIEIFKRSLYLGIAQAFTRYRKLDFFIYKINLQKMNRFLIKFVKIKQKYVLSCTTNEIKATDKTISKLIECYLISLCGELVSIDDLNLIMEGLSEDNSLDFKFDPNAVDNCIEFNEKINLKVYHNLFFLNEDGE